MAQQTDRAKPPSPLPAYVQPAILEFKRLEVEWLDSLPESKKQKLAGKKTSFEKEKNHFRSYGDFAFTLGGVKPCALLGAWFAKGLAEACLIPVMKKFNLEEHGFRAEEIKHNLLTSNPGFKGGWVILNTRHAGYPLAKKTFLERSPTGRVDEEQLRVALGYPLPSGNGTIGYIDATEAKDLNTCCVPVAEYCAEGPATVIPILEHYRVYQAFWKQLGRTLTIDTVAHPTLAAAFNNRHS